MSKFFERLPVRGLRRAVHSRSKIIKGTEPSASFNRLPRFGFVCLLPSDWPAHRFSIHPTSPRCCSGTDRGVSESRAVHFERVAPPFASWLNIRQHVAAQLPDCRSCLSRCPFPLCASPSCWRPRYFLTSLTPAFLHKLLPIRQTAHHLKLRLSK